MQDKIWPVATSFTTGAVVVSPLNSFCFVRQIPPDHPHPPIVCRFVIVRSKVILTVPSRPTDSVSSDTAERSGVSRLSNAKASDFIQPTSLSPFPLNRFNKPHYLSYDSLYPSWNQHLSKIHTHWSVDFNSDVKLVRNVKLEHVLGPRTSVLITLL